MTTEKHTKAAGPEHSAHMKQGLFVVVLGPDGSGKTTLLNKAKPELSRHFTTVSHYHWRPGLLPKLGRGPTSTTTSKTTIDAAPPKDFSYGSIISLVRYLYYLADFFLGYLLKISPRVRRGGLVIVERWHHDSLMNPQRYGFKVPARLLRLAHKIIPSPDLILILRGDAQTFHDRKPELTVPEIRTQIQNILRLVPQLPDSIHVYTDTDPELSTREFVGGILSVAHADTSSANHSWRAFPRFGRPKLWIDSKSSFQNACDLYAPRSRLARAVVKISSMLPSFLHSRRLSRSEVSLASRTLQRAGHLFPESDLSVDFYIGTPGPHQKLTARIADHFSVLGYCKAGFEQSVLEPLSNERNALQSADITTATCPQIIAFENSNGWVSLFITPPPSQTTPWPLVLEESEITFLRSLLPESHKPRSIDNVLEELSVDSSTLLAKEDLRIYECCKNNLKHAFADTPTLTGRSHGDFGPWNIKKLADNSLFLFDWEYSSPSAPVLTDLFHRHFSLSWLIRRESARQALETLLSLPGNAECSALIRESGIPTDHYSAYLLLYLLGIFKRQTLEGSELPHIITESIRLLLYYREDTNCLPRVLVSAYACEPNEGSEPGVGWHWVNQISQNFEAWVITRANNREPIEQALAINPNKNLHFVYVDLPPWLRKWKKKQRGVRTYYYLWQFAALLAAKPLHRKIHFDIGHHVTFVNDWLWTFFALTPIPFIWGPVGSHPPVPFRFIATAKERLTESMRLSIQTVMRIIDPLFWLSCIKARFILGINNETCSVIPLRYFCRKKCGVEPAIGIEQLHIQKPDKAGEPFNILFVGRFATVKAPLLALDAFLRLVDDGVDARLTFIGKGPLEKQLTSRINARGAQDLIDIKPWMERHEILNQMLSSDVFLFPSFEGGGMVVLEAMATGLPVVCMNYGGPGTMAGSTAGIRVDVDSYQKVVHALAAALNRLHDDPAYKHELSTNALTMARHEFTWDNKALKIKALYRHLIMGTAGSSLKQLDSI